jgi:hypothetical protein
MDGFDMSYFINLGFFTLSFLYQVIGGEPRLTIFWVPASRFYILCIDAEKSLWRNLVARGCNGVYFEDEGLTGYTFINHETSYHFCWLTGLNHEERYYNCLH